MKRGGRNHMVERGRNNLRRSHEGREAQRLMSRAEMGDEEALRDLGRPRMTTAERRVRKHMRNKKRRALPRDEMPYF